MKVRIHLFTVSISRLSDVHQKRNTWRRKATLGTPRLRTFAEHSERVSHSGAPCMAELSARTLPARRRRKEKTRMIVKRCGKRSASSVQRSIHSKIYSRIVSLASVRFIHSAIKPRLLGNWCEITLKKLGCLEVFCHVGDEGKKSCHHEPGAITPNCLLFVNGISTCSYTGRDGAASCHRDIWKRGLHTFCPRRGIRVRLWQNQS